MCPTSSPQGMPRAASLPPNRRGTLHARWRAPCQLWADRAPGPGRLAVVGRMEMRTLGRTGVQVSQLCLGAMMFGAWGNPDHDDSIRIIHRALDAGINFIDTADVYSRGESEEIVGKALRAAGATTSCWPPRSTARWATTRTSAATRGAGSSREVEDSLRRLQHRLDRPVPDPPPRPGHRHRRDARRADRPRPRRARSATSAARRSRPSQIVEAQWVAERRGRERFVCEQPPYSMLVRGDRGRGAADLRSATAWA